MSLVVDFGKCVGETRDCRQTKSILLADGFECYGEVLSSELVSMTAFVWGSLGSCFGDPSVIFALLDAQLMNDFGV